VAHLTSIAQAIVSGQLNLARVCSAPLGEARAELVSVKGIGPWTADIYLMFHLGHADVFAPGDLALQEAVRIGFARASRPSAKELATMSLAWSPWRAVAARLLWAYYAAVKARDGVGL